jgi:threonyl-tRNA synthetase
VIPIGENEQKYAEEFTALLKQNDIRAEIDLGNDSFGKKIRNAKTEKVPYIAVIGKKEVEEKTVTLEGRATKDVLSQDDTLKKLLEEIKSKA